MVTGKRDPEAVLLGQSGVIIREELAGWYRTMLKNTRSVSIGPGRHYLQEDNLHLIGTEIAKWMEQVVLSETK